MKRQTRLVNTKRTRSWQKCNDVPRP